MKRRGDGVALETRSDAPATEGLDLDEPGQPALETGREPAVGSSRWARFGGWAFLVFVLALLYVPLLILILFSFNDSIIIALPFKRFTLEWYRQVLADPRVLGALGNSFLLAATVTPVCLVLGTLAAVGLTRFRFRWRAVAAGMIAAPLVVPDLLIGVGALLLFIRLHFTLSLRSIFLMHVVDFFPVVTAIVSAQLFRFDRSLEEAALDLGATRREVLRYIILPLLGPALGASAIIVFSWSFNDLVVAFFTAGFQTTFPIWVYATLRHAVNLPVVNAIATIVTLGQIVIIYTGWRLARRFSAARADDRGEATGLLTLEGIGGGR
jgi:ABC-type spermidine/putrescine transport system permease subunit II